MTRRITATALMIGVLNIVSVSTAASMLTPVAANDSAPPAVERPGEQHRGRYQLHLRESRSLLTSARPVRARPHPLDLRRPAANA